MPPRPEIDNAAIAAMVAQQVAAIVPGIVQEVHQVLNQNPNPNPNPNPNVGGGPNPPQYTFKRFSSCNPPKFIGTEGATGLLQWFEGIENTFVNSDCPDNLRVRYAASILQKRALTWWNGEKRTRGADVALALPWNDFKRIMTAEFCPRSEIQKLESEFWELKQQGGEVVEYTTRFQELSILVPHMVTPLERAIEKYIGGLPVSIQGTVLGSRPTTLEEAIRLATSLTEMLIKAGTLTKKGSKKLTDIVTTNDNTTTTTKLASVTEEGTSSPKKKRKTKNYAATTPTPQNKPIPAVPINQVAPNYQPPAKKPYTGPHPQCPTCLYHHQPNVQCRICNTCGRYGHTANICRTPPQFINNNRQVIPLNQPQNQQQLPRQNNACFECGDPNHYRNQCPKLANDIPGARGRAFNLNVNNNQEDAAE